MSSPARLSALTRDYDVILCDVWGVIRDGRALIAQALDALKQFRAAGGTVILLSNSPQRQDWLLSHLAQLGAHGDNWDGAVTSGDAIFEELSRRAPGPAYKLGPDYDDGLYEGTGLTFAPLKDAAFISCTGLIDFETETPDQYRDLLSEAALRPPHPGVRQSRHRRAGGRGAALLRRRAGGAVRDARRGSGDGRQAAPAHL